MLTDNSDAAIIEAIIMMALDCSVKPGYLDWRLMQFAALCGFLQATSLAVRCATDSYDSIR
jgi:hypothetical protein